MNNEIVKFIKRETTGKASSNTLRNAGLIPAVVYGLSQPPMAIAVNPKTIAHTLASDSGVNSIICLKQNDDEAGCNVLIKEIQRNPITDRLSHIDFIRIDISHRVRVKVQIVLKGNSIGVKEGGILDFIHRDIDIECLPSLIPPHIDVNVENLKIGDSLRLEQLKLDAHIILHSDAHDVICSVIGKSNGEIAEESVASAEAGASTEALLTANKGKK